MYDDGSAESSQSWETGKGFALCVNRPFTPARVVGAGFCLLSPAPIQVHVWDESGRDLIAPFVAHPTGDGFFRVDLTDRGLVIADMAFYVGFTYTVDYQPDIQVDLDPPFGQHYEVDGAYFEKKTNGNFLIWAFVQY